MRRSSGALEAILLAFLLAWIPGQQAAFAKRIKDQRFDVPTIVITRAKSAEGSEPWVDSQQQLADAATHGKLVRAVGSGHDIQLEQPQLITGAVRELLATEKGNAKAR